MRGVCGGWGNHFPKIGFEILLFTLFCLKDYVSHPVPFSSANHWNNCTLIFPFYTSRLFILVLRKKQMGTTVSRALPFMTPNPRFESTLASFIDHYHTAVFKAALRKLHWLKSFQALFLNRNLNFSFFLPKTNNNGKYHLFNCSLGISKVALKRKREKSPSNTIALQFLQKHLKHYC